MEETAFYILGIGLTALALIIAAVGIRFESFPPSRPVLIGGTLVVAVIVLGTMTFAWLNGEEEQEHRNEEIAAGHELSPAEGLALIAEESETGGQPEPETGADEDEGADPEEPADEDGETAAADPQAGAQVFADNGCGGCHVLAAAGTSGSTGPDLDETLADKDEAYIEESIVDPNAEVASGYPPDVMPQNYGSDLSEEDLAALVAYLAESTGG